MWVFFIFDGVSFEAPWARSHWGATPASSYRGGSPVGEGLTDTLDRVTWLVCGLGIGSLVPDTCISRLSAPASHVESKSFPIQHFSLSLFLIKKILFTCLFSCLAVRGLCCCVGFSLTVASSAAVRGPLIVVASLVADHGL